MCMYVWVTYRRHIFAGIPQAPNDRWRNSYRSSPSGHRIVAGEASPARSSDLFNLSGHLCEQTLFVSTFDIPSGN